MASFINWVGDAVRNLNQQMPWKPRNRRAENFLRSASDNMIAEIDGNVRQVVHNILADGLAEGENPRVVALNLVGRIDPVTGARTGGLIGLGATDEAVVQDVEKMLLTLDPEYFNMPLRDKRSDRGVRKAITAGKPLTSEVVNKLVTRYRSNALRQHGENIARTEMMRALNQAEFESAKQVVVSGAVPDSAVWKEWDSTGDNRVRSEHRAMEGKRVRLDEPFVMPDGTRMMYPGDTSLGAGASQTNSCRCRLKVVVNWLWKYTDD